ncbi:MAG: 50S ribosomal protein L11 methyltransferase [Verrucomicrobia bacterium]|nr:50S ribosomal protein L11 methyltransferase [Verrucomicrobiota bacterium]
MSKLLRSISITTSLSAEDAVGVLLELEQGQTPSSYADALTRLSTVSVYGEIETRDVAGIKRRLREGLQALAADGIDIAPARIQVKKVPARDWSESWKRHFKPLDLGPRLLVKPTWSRRVPKKTQALMVLDPGLSFGTGQHATTRFCLEQLVALRDPQSVQSMLDVGTGSGILAIAAVKLGYQPVNAFDFDADCVRVANENTELNGVAAVLIVTHDDITQVPKKPKQRYSVVCANLIYDLLIAERDRLLARVTPGGSLVLAGILETQFGMVRKAFEEAGWKLVAATTDKEWRSGTFMEVSTIQKAR